MPRAFQCTRSNAARVSVMRKIRRCFEIRPRDGQSGGMFKRHTTKYRIAETEYGLHTYKVTMNNWLSRILITLLVGTFLFNYDAPPATAQTVTYTRVLVSFTSAPGQDEVSLIANFGGRVLQSYHLVPVILAMVPVNVIKSLSEAPGVVRVEADTVAEVPGDALGSPDNSPADVRVGEGARDNAPGQTLPWGVDKIGAPLVHPTNKGTGVKIAILDTGVDLTHPDLKIASQVTFVAGATSAQDDHGHGTMVAGIIGALDNDFGVIGVAPEAQVYAVKVLGSNGSGYIGDIINGLQWAVDNGMQVVNMSFGGGVWPQAGEQALNYACNAGIVLVAGAGNLGTADGAGDNIGYPARYNAVMAVGAVDEQLNRLGNSSTGYTLESVAPGSNIFTTALGGGYGLVGNTSAAAAHVSGAAALLIKAGVTNNLEVRRRLRDTALDLGSRGWDPQYGKGLINVYRAIVYQSTADKTAPVTAISLSGTAGNQGWYRSDVTVTLIGDDKQGSGIAETRYSLDNGATWNLYTSPFVIQTEGSINILARSWDFAGNDEGPPNFLTVKMAKTAPVITLSATPATIPKKAAGATLSVNIDASVGVVALVSGLASSNIRIVDAYGIYDQDYGPIRPIIASVEDWAKPDDLQGRIYTVVATAADVAGNTTIATTTVTVTNGTIASPAPSPSPSPSPTPSPTPTLTPIPTPSPTPPLSPTPAITPLPGDVNGDGVVNSTDLTLIISSYNERSGDPGFNPNADLNGDGIVDIDDLVTAGLNFGRTR